MSKRVNTDSGIHQIYINGELAYVTCKLHKGTQITVNAPLTEIFGDKGTKTKRKKEGFFKVQN